MLSIEKIKEITKSNKEKREQKIEKKRTRRKTKLIKSIDKQIIAAAETGSGEISTIVNDEFAGYLVDDLAREIAKHYQEKGFSADVQYSYRRNAIFLFIRWSD